jgi:hypothetical protein
MIEFNQTRAGAGLAICVSLVTMEVIVSEMKTHVFNRVLKPFLFTGLFIGSYYTASHFRDSESNKRALINMPGSITLSDE